MTSRTHWQAHERRRRILERGRLLYPDKSDVLETWRNHGREFVAGYAVHVCCLGFLERGARRVLMFDESWAKLYRAIKREPEPIA